MKRLINPPDTANYYDDWQMSQAVRVGDILWVSGQVGIDNQEQFAEDLEGQARRAFQNTNYILEEAGTSMDDVVELVTYHVSMKDLDIFRRVKSEFIQRDFPAWTAIGVTELYTPEALVEVKVTALINSGTESGASADRIPADDDA